MAIQDIDKLLQDDKEGASALFQGMRDAIHDFSEFYTQEYARLKDKEIDEKRKQQIRRQYALSRKKALDAVWAYHDQNKGWHASKKGDRRFQYSENALSALNELPRPDFTRMGLGQDARNPKNGVEEKIILARVALKEADDQNPENLQDLELMELYEKHHKLHRLMGPADDSGFLTSYLKNRQILENIKGFAKKAVPGSRHAQLANLIKDEESIRDLGVNAEIYERWLDTRAEMIASPVYHVLQNNRISLPDEEKEEKFCADYNVKEEDVRQYRLLEKERKHLIDMGIQPPKPYVSRKDVCRGSVGSENNKLTLSLLSGSFMGGKTGATKLQTAGKARLGKLGYKLNSKYFKLSASGSVGTIRGSGMAKISASSALLKKSAPDTVLFGEAQAYGAKGRLKVQIGGKNNNIVLHPEISFGSVTARAVANVGISTTTDAYGEIRKEKGLRLGMDFLAAGMSGKLAGGFSLFGIKVNVTGILTGASIGANAGIAATAGGMMFSIGAALGIGGKVLLSIDWSRALQNFKNWWHRGKRIDQEKHEEKIRENFGREETNQKKLRRVMADEEMPGIRDEDNLLNPENLGERIQSIMRRLNAEKGSAKGIYRETLELAMEKLNTLQNTPEDSSDFRKAADEAMSAVVCSNLIRVQGKMKVTGENSLSQAIRSKKHLRAVLMQIKKMNDRQPVEDKFWDSSGKDALFPSLKWSNINEVTRRLLTTTRRERTQNGIEAGKAEINNLADRTADKNGIIENGIDNSIDNGSDDSIDNSIENSIDNSIDNNIDNNGTANSMEKLF